MLSLQIEKMAAVASLDVLVSRLRDLIREYGELRSDPAKNQPPAGSGDFGEERDEDEEAEARFQREITTLMKKMEATKKAVPEGGFDYSTHRPGNNYLLTRPYS